MADEGERKSDVRRRALKPRLNKLSSLSHSGFPLSDLHDAGPSGRHLLSVGADAAHLAVMDRETPRCSEMGGLLQKSGSHR